MRSISLKDESENGDFLIKRWYRVNRAEIEGKVQQRRDAEEAEQRRKEEEERYRLFTEAAHK